MLQLVFIGAAIYGWFGWAPTGAVPGTISTRNRIAIAIGTLVSVAALSPVLANIGAAATWTDAFILIASLVAQLLMIYEKYETWVLWLIINVVATAQYLSLGYWFTAILYAVFAIVAILGWKRWHASLSN
jgi:nicotinamide mononucleotide transporter